MKWYTLEEKKTIAGDEGLFCLINKDVIIEMGFISNVLAGSSNIPSVFVKEVCNDHVCIPNYCDKDSHIRDYSLSKIIAWIPIDELKESLLRDKE